MSELTEYVIMPSEDYVAACDAIRAKTGKTDLIKSGDMKAEIEGIEVCDDPVAEEVGKWKLQSNSMAHAFRGCANLIDAPLFDTSKVINMSSMFSGCAKLTTVPLYNTGNVIDMASMFHSCLSIVALPLFDTSKATLMNSMLESCVKLTSVPRFDTRSATNINGMFRYDISLAVVPALDIRSATTATNIFGTDSILTECWLRNIKTNLQVGSGTQWGHLLTVESLIHLIYELRDTGSTKTLTMGNVNLAKLADVYVKTIDITDEMRAEDDLIDEKLPFVVCESADEGAMLITDYVAEKNWALA